MATFIMLTRLAHGAIRSPEELEKLEKEVMKRIEEGLGGGQVKWLANYAVLGPYDYLDIFEAPDIEADEGLGYRAHAWPCAHRGLGGNRVEAVQGDRPRPAERRQLSRRHSSAVVRKLWLMSEHEIASHRAWSSDMDIGSGAGEQNERQLSCDLASHGNV